MPKEEYYLIVGTVAGGNDNFTVMAQNIVELPQADLVNWPAECAGTLRLLVDNTEMHQRKRAANTLTEDSPSKRRISVV